MELDHGSQLVISLAESVDSGEYSCVVSALDKSVLTHHVNVRGENCEELDRNKPGLGLFYSVLFLRQGKQSQYSARQPRTLALADSNANMTKTFLVCSGKTFTGKWIFEKLI